MGRNVLPYRWYKPYEYQKEVFNAVDSGIRLVFLMWHRRSGKDLTSLCVIIREAIKHKGEYFYLFPAQTQGSKVIWHGQDNLGRNLLDYINPLIVDKISKTDKYVRLKNGSMIRMVAGRTDSNALRGTNPRGIVFSEAAWMSSEVWTTLWPAITANKGLMIFQSTPNGKNDFYKLYEKHKNSKHWFTSVKTIKDTRNAKGERIITDEDLEKEGTSKEKQQVEYFCQFSTVREGSYYSDLLTQAREEGRVGDFPAQDGVATDLYYDLGIDDSTSIWFMQVIEGKKYFVDYMEDSGKELEFYVKELKLKDYQYGVHYMPHDGNKRNIASGRSTDAIYRDLCLKHGISDYIVIAPRLKIQYGIQCVRQNFRQYHFHEYNCFEGLMRLENYRRKRDMISKEFKAEPVHDENSHAADALRVEGVIDQNDLAQSPKPMRRLQTTDFNNYNIWSE